MGDAERTVPSTPVGGLRVLCHRSCIFGRVRAPTYAQPNLLAAPVPGERGTHGACPGSAGRIASI